MAKLDLIISATQFAVEMGFEQSSLTTKESQEMHQQWLSSNCQPNFWKVGRSLLVAGNFQID